MPYSILDKYLAMVYTSVNHDGPKKMIDNCNPNLQKLRHKYASICVACMFL